MSASSTNVPGWPTSQHDVHIHVQLHPRNCCLKLFSKAPWLKFAQHLRPPTPLYHSGRWQRRSAKLLEPECSLCPIARSMLPPSSGLLLHFHHPNVRTSTQPNLSLNSSSSSKLCLYTCNNITQCTFVMYIYIYRYRYIYIYYIIYI